MLTLYVPLTVAVLDTAALLGKGVGDLLTTVETDATILGVFTVVSEELPELEDDDDGKTGFASHWLQARVSQRMAHCM